MSFSNKKIKQILNLSEEELLLLKEEDNKIDKGERLDWEMSEEEEKEFNKQNRVKIKRKK